MLPAGTFSETYEQDKAFIRTRLQWGLFVFFLGLVFTLPLFVPSTMLGMVNLMGIFMVAAFGLQIVTGYAGLINLGQSALMGVGGFTGCLASMTLNTPIWLSLIIGALAACVYGLIFAIPAVRIKGFYLAVTTLAAQLIFAFIGNRIPREWFLGTSGGFRVTSPSFMGIQVSSEASYYYLIFSMVLLIGFFTFSIGRSRLGRAFMAVRDNDIAAEVMGVNIVRYKFLAFAICAAFAGIAGVLMGYYMRWVSVDSFTLWHSIWIVGMVIIGGLGRGVLGVVLGTIFLRGIQEIVSTVGPGLVVAFPQLGAGFLFSSMNFVIGVTIVVFLVFQPRGLAHRWELFKNSYRIWPFPYE